MVVVGNGKQETDMKWREVNKFPYQILLDSPLNLYRELGVKRSAMIWQASSNLLKTFSLENQLLLSSRERAFM